MHSRKFQLAVIFVSVATLSALNGCAPPSKPTVVIESPAGGIQFSEGDDVVVQSTSTDAGGIVRVELAVDGTVVRTDTPIGQLSQPNFSLVQQFKAIAGTHALSVRAYNVSGVPSDPALTTIIVVSSATAATPVTTTQLTPTTVATGPTPTVRLVTATRAPRTPTVAAQPGVYAVGIRLQPAAPKSGNFVTFFVTFLNTTGKTERYNWFVKMYEPAKSTSFGETAKLEIDIPPGTREFASKANWNIAVASECMEFNARVFWADKDNQVTEFVKPDRSGGPATAFFYCP